LRFQELAVDKTEILDLTKIESLLQTRKLARPSGAANELWQTIDSTNSRALTLQSDGIMVVARQQTAGRGRLGRTWMSPLDAGVYVSFRVSPEPFSEQLSLVTMATGLACVKAVQASTGIILGIKWVNDLILVDRKVGGILAELVGVNIPAVAPNQPSLVQSSLTNRALIIGIGINISRPIEDPPPELASTMTWLSESGQSDVDPNLLVAQIAFELEKCLEALSEGMNDFILDGWRRYSVTLGQRVVARVGSQTIEGDAIDIDQSGALLLNTTAGLRTLHAGEVSIRSASGGYV
jgi:BirA family biotin operon repressor/biotin-[acetyl-CoA-carboxylase] ligase